MNSATIDIDTYSKRIESEIRSQWDEHSPEAGFCSYVMSSPSFPLKPILCESKSQLSAPCLSYLGYFCHTKKPQPSQIALIKSSLERLMAKDPLPSDRQSFAFRAIEFLGICILHTALKAGDSHREVLSTIIYARRNELAKKNGEIRLNWLYSISATILGIAINEGPLFNPAELSAEELSLAIYINEEFIELSKSLRIEQCQNEIRHFFIDKLIELDESSSTLPELSLTLYAMRAVAKHSAKKESHDSKHNIHSSFLEREWVPIVGVGIGFLTMCFLMALVVASLFGNVVPQDTRFIVVCILSMGCAFSFAFIGGSAAVKGRVKVPFMEIKPVEFSVFGGFAVFIIILLLSYTTYVRQPVNSGAISTPTLKADLE